LRVGVVWFLILTCAYTQHQVPQNQEAPPPEQPTEEYFSGTVVAYGGESVMVARTVLGKTSSARRFVITSETQIEGKLKVKCRVTVQYITKEEVDHALHIIVRATTPKK
jgi:hypothetical protein